MLATVHYMSLFVYACVIAHALIDLDMLRKCTKAGSTLKSALLSLLVLVVLQATALAYLQTSWLYNNPEVYISQNASLVWLAFDLLSGLVMLVYVISIHIFLGWKTEEDSNIVEVIDGIRSQVRETD